MTKGATFGVLPDNDAWPCAHAAQANDKCRNRSRLRRGALGGRRFRKQHPIGPYIADFACVAAKLVVEVDGDSHGADAAVVYDRRRDVYMNEQGWRVLRVTNEDVFKRLDDVMDGIARALQRTAE